MSISNNAFRDLYVTWDNIVDKLREIYSNLLKYED